MTGKVFPGSTDVIDDQAAVLYEYLSQVAKGIVGQEMQLEQSVATAEEEKTQKAAMAKSKGFMVILFFVLAVAALALVVVQPVLGVIPAGLAIVGGVSLVSKKKLLREIVGLDEKIAVFKGEHAKIRRDYKVHKLGVVFSEVARRIPFEGKSFLLDHTGQVPNQEFNLYTVNNQDEFIKNIQELDTAVGEVPLVESAKFVEEVNTGELSKSIQQVPFFDYLGTLDRNMRSASFLLNDLTRNSVSMPVIDPAGPHAAFLREHATEDATFGPVLPVFATDTHAADVEKFQALNDLRKSMEGRTAQFEDFLQDLMSRLASTVQVVTRMKMGSTNILVERANQMMSVAFKAAFNHYSPQLEVDEIERIRGERFDYQESLDNYKPFELKKSSRVKYDAFASNWVSEDGRRTSFPFGVLQIHEEIVAPVVQSLMLETRIERLKIYNAIKDQKIDYLNQWHRDTDDFYGRNRAEGANLINRMQSTLTEFTAAFNQYKAFEDTLESMMAAGGSGRVEVKAASSETLLAYANQSAEFVKIQAEFNDYVDRLKDEINRKADEFGYIEFYDASLRDMPAKDYAGAMARAGSLDERRKMLLAVNPHFAEKADLPPAPDVSESVYQNLATNLVEVARDALRDLRPADVARATSEAAGTSAETEDSR